MVYDITRVGNLNRNRKHNTSYRMVSSEYTLDQVLDILADQFSVNWGQAVCLRTDSQTVVVVNLGIVYIVELA